MSQAKSVKEVLIAARWILENVGWCQNSFYLDKGGKGHWSLDEINPTECGGACSSGALFLVEAEDELVDKAGALLAETIGNILYHSIPAWNDDAERTEEQVLAMFDKAIERAEHE